MESCKLPIGIQNFREIRDGGYCYVDKTRFIHTMAERGKYYFLSRPRRFGKSLLVDTMDCAFSGKQDLFRGLFLEENWDWETRHPILRIDFAAGIMTEPKQLTDRLHRILDRWTAQYSLSKTAGTPGERFEEILKGMAVRTGITVVLLIDEYDKPILDNMDTPKTAVQMQDVLKDFYSAVKPADGSLRFVFVTGVSKFSKTGVFSGLNNLNDITLSPRYSALCGYTESDLDSVFPAYFEGRDREKVRAWYNGYSWLGERVYNPFDVLLYLEDGGFRNYWFESGTPTFLLKLWKEKPFLLADLEDLIVGQELIDSFEIEDLKTETLLFQTGYLTIRDTRQVGTQIRYALGYPNIEVKSALNQLLFSSFTQSSEVSRKQLSLDRILYHGSVQELRVLLESVFSSLSHDWHRKNDIAFFEGFYASVLYALFASMGYEIIPEDTTNHGRIDLTVKTSQNIWIFEFKVKSADRSGGMSPLRQLIERRYAEKYRSDGRDVYLIGITFDPQDRNILEYEVG